MTPDEVKKGLANMLIHLGACGNAYDSQAHLVREALRLIAEAYPASPRVCTSPPASLEFDGDGAPAFGRACPSCWDE